MKRQKGRTSNVPCLKPKTLGDYSIISLEPARITAAQIAAVILTMKRNLPNLTSIIPRVYAHLAVTQKPSEVRMGKGKGSIAKRVARVRINTVLFEIGNVQKGIPSKKYTDVLEGVSKKLPVLTKIVKGDK